MVILEHNIERVNNEHVMGILDLFKKNNTNMSDITNRNIEADHKAHELVNACYNKDTNDFNWTLYHEKKNDILDDDQAAKYLDKLLKDIGHVWVNELIVILRCCRPEEVQEELSKKRDRIINILGFYTLGFWSGANCPETIERIRKELLDICDNEILCTKEKVDGIISYYNEHEHEWWG